MVAEQGMIEPFSEDQVREAKDGVRVISYGYDLRVSNEFRVFTPTFSAPSSIPRRLTGSRLWI